MLRDGENVEALAEALHAALCFAHGNKCAEYDREDAQIILEKLEEMGYRLEKDE